MKTLIAGRDISSVQMACALARGDGYIPLTPPYFFRRFSASTYAGATTYPAVAARTW